MALAAKRNRYRRVKGTMLKNKLMTACVTTVISVIGISSVAQGANWWESLKLKGDLRYRHEMIDKQDKDVRHRQRLRARIGIYGDVSQYTKIGIQLATGSDDPVSTNQTLDDAFSTKRIGLDLAYFQSTHDALPGLTITGGKFKNPFFRPGKAELIWDSDWNPEGGVVTLKKDADNFSLTLTGAGLWIDERSSDDDSYLAAGQGVARFHLNEKTTTVTVGGSFFNYVNAQGFQPFFDHEDAMGNSVVLAEVDGDTVLHYANDYEILEFFGQVTHTFENTPVTVMGDFVTNTAADSLETGWLFGLRVGKAKKPGSWEFRYIYRKVEKDAVIGMFTDSDFRGGGTDAKGHEIGGALQLAKNTAFKLTYFINEIGLEEDKTDDISRLQADIQLKF